MAIHVRRREFIITLVHIPAQEMRWPSEGNRLMSVPISETITCAPMSLIPGIVITWPTAAHQLTLAPDFHDVVLTNWPRRPYATRA